MNLNKNNNEKINLDQLVSKLKTEDTRYARIVKGFQVVYWIFIPLYSLLTILTYVETGNIKDLIGGMCYVISFLIFALVFGKFYKKYKYVDYSLSTIEMLKEAADRYKPFKFKTLWIVIGLLFIDAGLCLNSSLNFPVLKVQVSYLGLLIVAVIIGLIIWAIKYKPLRDNALSLVAEIEGD
jgi:H+/gluconate symporter-like permease